MTSPPPAPRCPHCRRGIRVPHTYELAGVTYDDSYCGVCGKNWPRVRPMADERRDAGETHDALESL